MFLLNLNPILKFSHRTRKRLLGIFAASTFILFVYISILDFPLKTTASPNGIVSFELARTFEQSQKILSSWNHQAKLSAIKSLVVDYLFLISYSFFFAFLIFKTSENFIGKKNGLVSLGIVFGWLQFVAAIFDAFENYFLLRLLFGSQNELFSSLAFYFASVKFILIILGIIYIVFGAILFLSKKFNYTTNKEKT